MSLPARARTQVSVDQVGSKDSDDTHGGLVQLIAEVSVDQVGSKDSD